MSRFLEQRKDYKYCILFSLRSRWIEAENFEKPEARPPDDIYVAPNFGSKIPVGIFWSQSFQVGWCIVVAPVQLPIMFLFLLFYWNFELIPTCLYFEMYELVLFSVTLSLRAASTPVSVRDRDSASDSHNRSYSCNVSPSTVLLAFKLNPNQKLTWHQMMPHPSGVRSSDCTDLGSVKVHRWQFRSIHTSP